MADWADNIATRWRCRTKWESGGICILRAGGNVCLPGLLSAGSPSYLCAFVLSGFANVGGMAMTSDSHMLSGWSHREWKHSIVPGPKGTDWLWIGYSADFLSRFLAKSPPYPDWLTEGMSKSMMAPGLPSLPPEVHHPGSVIHGLARLLADPPVAPMARDLWFRAKAIEFLTCWIWPVQESLNPGKEGQQNSLTNRRITRAKEWITKHMDEPLDMAGLSRYTACSSSYISRVFKSDTGKTLKLYLRAQRISRAANLLENGRMNVSEVAIEVGYKSFAHFSRAFQHETGVLPSQWNAKRQGG